MIINGKNIVGLYKYDPNSTFTQGDIVYKDSTLYIALTEVSGIDPSDNIESIGKYQIYLGDKCVSIDDYLNYEKTEDSKLNKYIPANLLPVILNHYLSGVSEKGVIEPLNDSDDMLESYITADDIMTSDTINNAIYTVDRNLEGLPTDLYSSSSGKVNSDKLILKQYTYYEKEFINSIQEKRKVRVQELIDHSQYMVWYRYKKIGSENPASEWRSITMNTSNIYDNVVKLADEYKSRIDILQKSLNNLKKNFMFRPIDLKESNSNYVTIPNDYNESKMTVVVLCKSGNGIYKCINFTFSMLSSIKKYESDGCYLLVSDGKFEIFEDKNLKVPHRKAFINEVYAHEFYK